MAHASITFNADVPTAHVDTMSTGRRFATLDCGDVTLHLPGYNGEAAAFARTLAATLTAAAETLEATAAPDAQPIAQKIEANL